MWKSQTATFSRRLLKQQNGIFSRHVQQWTGDNRYVMAIRREDVNVWERRAPLSPHHVRRLVKKGVKVIVQPSNRRAYPMQEYINHGAIIQEDISEATFIVGVKQVPIDVLLPNRTYAFFSHTIKAQETNMSLLDAVLQKNIRLIDYEKMCDEQGQRVVAFGKYAGVAGMINILHGLGLRLLALGHHTPFMHIGPSHNYRNSEMARRAIRDAGYEICLGMMPKSVGPLTFVFTGSGNVSQGAQEVFQELPYEYIEPEYLSKVARQGASNKIYACVVSREDHYVRNDGAKFNAEEFEQHPERFVSTFSQQIAPYASCIVNGIYYAPNSPRLMSIPDAKMLLSPTETPWIPSSKGCPKLPHRLLAICDISADPGGSIEFMKECTTIDSPFCLYDADRNMNTESFAGSGVLICSIDNMPAQIPREATDFFGGLLLPYVFDMIESDATKPFEEYTASPVVKNAVIASNGHLTPNFEYIAEMRNKKRSHHKARVSEESLKKKALILGAGYVSGPAVEYLSRDENIEITVASQYQEELDNVAQRFPDIELSVIDITHSCDSLDTMIRDSDVVVSLLPYTLHPDVAKLCIKNGTNMVTASYLLPAMKELNDKAVEAGVTIVNEVGVDPGIDHMLAMECFDSVHQHGGKVTSFLSWCGGLPAPEHSDTPLRYKFSWFPKGVLMNVLTGARYLDHGDVIDIAEGGGLLDSVCDLDFLPGFNLEGFANRDSTPYRKRYGIESCQTLLRGTIRYKGFSEAMKSLLAVGLLDDNPHATLHPNGAEITWKNLICDLLGVKSDILVDSVKDHVLERVDNSLPMLHCIEDLGLLSDDVVDKRGSPLDTLSNYLSKRLAFGPGERDLILLRHNVEVQWLDNSREMRQVGLVVYGDTNGFSAMAKTVGLPTGIATKMVLEGEIQKKGMVVPLSADIYRPILQRLELEGLTATEVVKPLSHVLSEERLMSSYL